MEHLKRLLLRPGQIHQIPDADKLEPKSLRPNQSHMTLILSPAVINRESMIPGISNGEECVLTISLTTRLQETRPEEAIFIAKGANPEIRRDGYADPATARPMLTRQLLQGIQSKRYRDTGTLHKSYLQKIWTQTFAYRKHHAASILNILNHYTQLTAKTQLDTEATRKAASGIGKSKPPTRQPARQPGRSIMD